VFGKVVAGMDVVDRIKATPTGTRGPYQNVPLAPVIIKTARVVK
jgi:peptidyl-prolyl cis-trans isomerase A (cyclophilin A)